MYCPLEQLMFAGQTHFPSDLKTFSPEQPQRVPVAHGLHFPFVHFLVSPHDVSVHLQV